MHEMRKRENKQFNCLKAIVDLLVSLTQRELYLLLIKTNQKLESWKTICRHQMK